MSPAVQALLGIVALVIGSAFVAVVIAAENAQERRRQERRRQQLLEERRAAIAEGRLSNRGLAVTDLPTMDALRRSHLTGRVTSDDAALMNYDHRLDIRTLGAKIRSGELTYADLPAWLQAQHRADPRRCDVCRTQEKPE